jgi:hypothetical protein
MVTCRCRVSYRLVMDVTQSGLDNSDFSGITAILTCSSGSFNPMNPGRT